MTIFPVIVRELRSESRQPFTYWLRVLAGGSVLVIFALLILRFQRMGSFVAGPAMSGASPFGSLGAILFGQLNATLFVCTCFATPLLTADCISREKREGTLGLLFLTRLNAGGIVIGKSFVHALRGAAIFLAMLPVLAVPILLGGVSARDCAMAMLIDSTAFVFGLAAGLLASSFGRDWLRTLVLAEILSVTFVLWFMLAHATAFNRAMTGTGINNLGAASFINHVIELFRFHTNLAQESFWGRGWTTTWNDVWSLPPATALNWFWLTGGYALKSVLVLGVAVVIAAWRVRRAWREQPAPQQVVQVQRALTQPRFAVRTLRRRLSRSLDRNPIGWLQQYSWNARLAKWGWFGVLVALELLLVSDPSDFGEVQHWVLLVFLAGVAFTAASSFRRERETGALELLLVCPLRINQIIGGRLRGIWMQCLPSAALLILCVSVGLEIEENFNLALYLIVGAALVTTPLIGLFFSMCRISFLAGWICTALLGVIVPFFFFFLGVGRFLSIEDYQVPAVFLTQIASAGFFWWLLHSQLKHRRFVMR